MSLSGSAKRNLLTLWLIVSTLSSFRLTKPWSPPVKAFLLAPCAESRASARAPGGEERKP